MSKFLKLLLIFIIVVIAGSLRNVVFVSLNNQISFLNGEIPDNGLLSYMEFIENYSLQTLIKLKWLFTIIYTLFYLLLGRYVLSIIFGSKDFAQWYTIAYVLIFIFSGTLFCIGYFLGSTESMFSLARTFMGALQSPVPLLIICPLLFLKKHL